MKLIPVSYSDKSVSKQKSSLSFQIRYSNLTNIPHQQIKLAKQNSNEWNTQIIL